MLKIAFEEITFQLGNEDRLRRAPLQGNRTLKEFHIKDRQIRDDYLRVITDGLVGNTTLEVLEIRVISGYRGNLTPINAIFQHNKTFRVDTNKGAHMRSHPSWNH